MYVFLKNNLIRIAVVLVLTGIWSNSTKADEITPKTSVEQQESTTAEEVSTKETITKETATKDGHTKKEFIQVDERIHLYKGEKRGLDLSKKIRGTKVSFKSSKPKVVQVSKGGKIKAKKCGTSIITVISQKGRKSIKTKLSVDVSISRFYHTADWVKNKKMKTKMFRVFNIHREGQKNKKYGISIQNIEKNAKITYKSSNTRVAKISGYNIKEDEATVYFKTHKEGTTTIDVFVTQNGTKYPVRETIHVVGSQKAKISGKEINKYFSNAAFIGNSVGVGQRMYFDSKGKGFLGNPTMLVKGSYSFRNDSGSDNNFRLSYRGVAMCAKDAVKSCKAKKVFINMGINDMWMGAQKAYGAYVKYIKGIQSKNPGIVIFIESTTPVYKAKQMSNLNNRSVNTFNSLIKNYCKKNRDLYYLDVNSILKDSSGGLRREYTSDSFVHMTMKGYEVWTNKMVWDIKKLLLMEHKAEDAVKTALESRKKADRKKALKMIKKLESSSLKTQLKKKLKRKK